MTDRITALTVVLRHDIREDDVEHLIEAIKQFRNVGSVTAHVSNLTQHVAEQRAIMDLGQRIIDQIYPPESAR